MLDRAIFWVLFSWTFLGPLLISPWGFDIAALIKESFLVFSSGILLLLILPQALAERRLPFREIPLGKPILLLLAVSLISLFRAVNTSLALHRLALVMSGISLYCVATTARLDARQVARLAKGVVASASVATLYVFLQGLRLDPLFPPTVGLASTLGNPNFLGEYLVVAIPIGLSLAWTPDGARGRLYGGAALFLLAGLLLTKARGATLALAVALVILGLFLRRKGIAEHRPEIRRLLPLAALAVVMVAVFGAAFLSSLWGPGGPGGLLERYIASRGLYFKWRLVFYGDALKMALDNPLFGVGIGNFQTVYPLYRTMPETLDPKHFVLDHAHNDYLELWAEVGVGGLIALLWILWAFFREMRRADRSPALAVGYTAAVAAIAVNSLLAFGLYNPIPWAAFWLCMALALRLRAGNLTVDEAKAEGRPERLPPVWTLLMVAPAIAALLYLSVKPLIADAYLSRGYELLTKGQARQAIPLLERVTELSPGRSEAQVYRAEAYYHAKRPLDAIASLDKYRKHDPYNFQVYYILGLCAEQVGDEERALRAYDDARRIYPFFSKPLLQIGQIRERRGDRQGAMAAYREALGLNPAFAEAANNLAILLSDQGRLDEAIQVWEKGAAASPDDLVIARNLALAYAKIGQHESARPWAERAERLRSRRPVH